MCGILGLLDPHEPVSADLYRGALALQHRGQDGAGLATFENRFYYKSGLGLLPDVFRHEDLDAFRGRVGLAHLRYATSGAGAVEECQPFLLSFPFGLALVHNGNITNDQTLRQRLVERGHRLVNSSSDSDTVLHVLADALAQEDMGRLTVDGIMRATRRTMEQLEGAYSVIVVIANHGMLAFRDPRGIRPLIMGRRGEAVAIASESVALDVVSAAIERDVRPGEAIFVDLSGRLHHQQVAPARPAHCAFEYVYLARPESVIDGRPVSEVRECLGESLAAGFEAARETDVAFDVPSSAEDAAISFSRAAGIPYRKGIRKNFYVQRSFIAANQSLRSKTAGMKFHLERRVISDQRVAVIDDSIVRGTTARLLIARLRRKGAKRINFFSAAPPVTHPCVYGVDMAVRDDLLAATMSQEQMARHLDVDYLQFQTIADLAMAVGPETTCRACFTGEYPTAIAPETLARYGRARQLVHTAPLTTHKG